MSGGLDSPALAATAVQLGAQTTAFTSVFDRLIPDEEGHYAGLVAEHIGIPIRYTVRDDELWGWEQGSVPIHTPDPLPNPLTLASHLQYHREIAAHARVFFFGDGPDASLTYEWRSHLAWLISKRRWLRLGRDLFADFAACRRVPVFHRLPRIWRERGSKNPDFYQPAFPKWFNKEFEVRGRLLERWDEVRNEHVLPHPTRPVSYSSFACDFPITVVESFDAGYTFTPSDFFHPFLYLCLLQFFLTVPAVPWCREKHLMRRALKGLIPEAVRLRPKSPLRGHPYLEQVRRFTLPELAPAPELERYVDLKQLPQQRGQEDREEIDFELRILGLRYWLLGL
jgi:asparagine synthase (glutamine-hydrolysing)